MLWKKCDSSTDMMVYDMMNIYETVMKQWNSETTIWSVKRNSAMGIEGYVNDKWSIES